MMLKVALALSGMALPEPEREDVQQGKKSPLVGVPSSP